MIPSNAVRFHGIKCVNVCTRVEPRRALPPLTVQYLTQSAWRAHETGFKARHDDTRREGGGEEEEEEVELSVCTNYPSTWLDP